MRQPVRRARGRRRRRRRPAHAEHVPARIRDDLDAIAAATVELAAGTLAYEDALADYFAALLRAYHGDASAIWSIDGVHAEYLRRG